MRFLAIVIALTLPTLAASGVVNFVGTWIFHPDKTRSSIRNSKTLPEDLKNTFSDDTSYKQNSQIELGNNSMKIYLYENHQPESILFTVLQHTASFLLIRASFNNVEASQAFYFEGDCFYLKISDYYNEYYCREI